MSNINAVQTNKLFMCKQNECIQNMGNIMSLSEGAEARRLEAK